MGNGERGGDFTMAMSVLNQEALERNQNTFFFFFWQLPTPPLLEESRKDSLFQNQRKYPKTVINLKKKRKIINYCPPPR